MVRTHYRPPGMPTSRLNETIKRNADHFPEGFRFQLSREEFARSKSQFATSNTQPDTNEPTATNWPPIATSLSKHRGARPTSSRQSHDAHLGLLVAGGSPAFPGLMAGLHLWAAA